MTPAEVGVTLREWARRVWALVGGRRSDDDLRRELATHVAFAEDELRRRGHPPSDAARLARAAAGGHLQALDALREQRGVPWLGSSWLDVKVGLRLLSRNWGLTLVGGLATCVAISIAAVVFTGFDVVMRSPLPLDEGDRVVAIQVWDRQAGRRRDTTTQDVDRWRRDLRSVVDVGVFQALQRNVIAPDGSVELAVVAEMSAAGFRVARTPAFMGRPFTDADEAPGAAPVVVIGHDVWRRRFGGAGDVIGRPLRLGHDVHTIVGVMPDGFQFPVNFRYWVPWRGTSAQTVRNTGLEGAVFGRLAPGVTLARAHAEVSARGLLPAHDATEAPLHRGPPAPAAPAPRVVPYTFAFTGDFEPATVGLLLSLAPLGLLVLLLPPCANIAILNYARIVTRQQEFAARHALGGSRARIVWQLFLESLLLTTAAAAVAALVVHAFSVVVAGRLQNVSGGPPFWMTFGVSYRTLLFVAGLAVVGAAVSGLVPALQATSRLARLGAGAIGGRVSVRLGPTWTTLVIAQVAFSVGVLPLAAELAWGTLRTALVGPGFAAEDYATARVTLEGSPEPLGHRQRELTQRLEASPGIRGVTAALRPPGDEPWAFVDIEGLDPPATVGDVFNDGPSGFQVRFNQVDAAFFDLYQVPTLGGRRFDDSDASATSDAVLVNRNLAETIAPGGNALGRRFRYARPPGAEWMHAPAAERWYEVVGIVGNLPATTDARVAYHPAAPGQLRPVHLQIRLGGDPAGLAERLRDVAARVDPALHVDEVRTLDALYREHRFGDMLGATTIGAISGSVLLLSAAGLYALMAFTVAERRREIGIRTALGAQPSQLVSAVFRRAIGQVGAGAAAGMLASFTLHAYVPVEQIGGLPIPGVLPGAAALMLCAGVLASWGPARRGLRIDPTEAMRGE